MCMFFSRHNLNVLKLLIHALSLRKGRGQWYLRGTDAIFGLGLSKVMECGSQWCELCVNPATLTQTVAPYIIHVDNAFRISVNC